MHHFSDKWLSENTAKRSPFLASRLWRLTSSYVAGGCYLSNYFYLSVFLKLAVKLLVNSHKFKVCDGVHWTQAKQQTNNQKKIESANTLRREEAVRVPPAISDQCQVGNYVNLFLKMPMDCWFTSFKFFSTITDKKCAFPVLKQICLSFNHQQ